VEPASDWRLIEPEQEQATRIEPGEAAKAVPVEDHVPRQLVGAIGALVVTAVAVAIWATMPAGGAAVESSSGPFDPRVVAGVARTPAATAANHSAAATHVAEQRLIVDIEGAVAAPGVHELADGSRVGDAIAAAGGYAANVDIAVASHMLNLAAKVTDGQQIHVPVLGETAAAPAGGGGPGDAGGQGGPGASAPAAAGGLIDVNHATAEELDTLPGIGPVTAAKIIDARTQAPFATVDELESRGVVGASTFEKLRDLVTVTP